VSVRATILSQVTGSSLVRPARIAGSSVRNAVLSVRRRLVQPGAALRWPRELLLVVVLYVAYEGSRGVADGDLATALRNGRALLSWETASHLDPERWLNHLIDNSTFLAVVSSYYYSLLHYVVTPAVLIWMFRSYPAHYRFARTTLAISTVIGMAGFFLVPTAPPRLLPGSPVHDTLAQFSSWGWWDNHGSVPKGFDGLSNQFAAMPSLHVGWALWAGFLLMRFGKHWWTRAIGVGYPIGTVIVVIATGNHYLLDAVAGGATIAAAGGLALLWYGRRVVAEADAITENAAREQNAQTSCSV
jgi:PAP2 superfamily protein